MKLKQFFEDLLKWFDEISPLMIGLLFSTIPMLIHSFYALYINEKESIPDFLRMSSSAMAAIGIEFLVFLYALKGKGNNIWIAWGFFLCQIILNLLYYLAGESNLFSAANAVRVFLAITVPSSIMAYSHLITKIKEERLRLEKELKTQQTINTISETTQAIVTSVAEIQKNVKRFPKRTKEEIALNIPPKYVIRYRKGTWKPPITDANGNVIKTKIII